ncbi:MAG: thiosulfate oxidation carrier protein SoxY [Hyphomicrobiaceae bacterium]|nr:thiosulfate oxidation carrier protein SoxY [Hyphomicrobiaceae bacterium]
MLVVASRRRFIAATLATAVTAVLAPFGAGLVPARAASAPPADFDGALKSILGAAQPVDGLVTLELPEIADNGNTVPFSVTVESAMTETDYIKAIHLLSTGNPQAVVATFYLSPASGVGKVAGRMRLAKTQDVVAVAELSDGRFAVGRRNVKVTIGGCGG